MTDLSPYDDAINSRDVIARLAELDDEVEAGELDEDDEDFVDLLDFNEQGEAAFSDWLSGITLISENHFEEYARQYFEETNPADLGQWPYNCIDWGDAAEELQVDYTPIEYSGETFWGLA